MFLRILTKAIIHRRSRVLVAMIALIVGAAVAAAMLSVYYDAVQKISHELRAYGANVAVAPVGGDGLIDERVLDEIAASRWPAEIDGAAPFLYVVVNADTPGGSTGRVVLAGAWFDQVRKISPWWRLAGQWPKDRASSSECIAGVEVARQLGLNEGQTITLSYGGEDGESGGPSKAFRRTFQVSGIATTGAEEDNQILTSLASAQELSGLQGRASAIAVRATGGPERIEQLAAQMTDRLDGVRARPIRQIAESEGRVLSKLRLMMLLVTVLILAAATLSASTTLTALVLERRPEIGAMKAIGAQDSRLLRLFLFELGALGTAGGFVGYLLGLGLAQAIGRSLFHSPVAPRLVVFCSVMVISVAVALLSGLVPVRRIREVEPALILRGD